MHFIFSLQIDQFHKVGLTVKTRLMNSSFHIRDEIIRE